MATLKSNSGSTTANLQLSLVNRAVQGDQQALREVTALIEEVSADARRTLKQAPSFGQELKSALLSRLFVAKEGASPRILTFAGRSNLRTWLGSTALRLGLNLVESQKRTGDSLRESYAGEQTSPDEQLIRSEYEPHLKAAIEGALHQLPNAERALMRLVFVEGVSLEQAGKMRGVHKSTISRQVSRVRAVLLAAVRARLAETLQVPHSQLSSLTRHLTSQLDVSLERLLSETHDGT
jgi:RNA polymerase sigma-70 factor, ECF subfamily